MANIVEGFDSRSWGGVLPPYLAERFKFVGIKISQGKSWEPADRATLVKQWRRSGDVYELLRKPFHFWVAPGKFEDPEKNGREQAQNFYDTLLAHYEPSGYLGELHPAIDVESVWFGMAGGNARARSVLSCLKETERLWKKIPFVYTAEWYWGPRIHPWFEELLPEYWEYYPLWESDPPPDTPISGWGQGGEYTQIQLDITLSGFLNPYGGLATIDINETTEEVLAKYAGHTPSPPPSPDCSEYQQEIERLKEVVEIKQRKINKLKRRLAEIPKEVRENTITEAVGAVESLRGESPGRET